MKPILGLRFLAVFLFLSLNVFSQTFRITQSRQINKGDTSIWNNQIGTVKISDKSIVVLDDVFAITQYDQIKDGSYQYWRYICSDTKGIKLDIKLSDFGDMNAILSVVTTSFFKEYKLVKI